MTVKGLTPGAFDPRVITEVQYPFELAEYKSRLDRIRERMSKEKIDLLYVTTPEAICYIHGYYASWYKANSPMRYANSKRTRIYLPR
jgi:Xaa-Pro aminopeptidase